MKSSKILREISSLLKVEEKDIPRTLERFKKEIEEMERDLRGNI